MSAELRKMALAGEIDWLSFYFAEFVAKRAQCEMDDLPGLSAALVCDANLHGDVCILLDDFGSTPVWQSAWVDHARLGAPRDAADWRDRLAASNCVGGPGDSAPLILDQERLYLNRYWRYESQVARHILSLLDRRGTADPAPIEPPAVPGDETDPDQLDAILRAARQSFCVISGGPGSGKTTTVVRILLALTASQPELRIALAAPTGRAAARMLESIRAGSARLDIAADALPDTAATLHRLLGYRGGGYLYGRDHRLPVDCVVVDEASMIDIELMYRLLEALPDHARLILLGDRDQLASVSAGNVLGDITGHGFDPGPVSAPIAAAIVLLRRSYRFDSGGGIGRLAALVNRGESQAALSLLGSDTAELGWHAAPGDGLAATALQRILDAYQAVFDANSVEAALDAFATTRVLAATNRGELGVESLNRQVASQLLARNRLAETEHYQGMPIMILRNRHDLGIYNGDTGILWQDENGLRAWFRDSESGLRDFALNRLPEYAPAWVSTVHKSQGAEYDSVVLVLPATDDTEALSRELLYTAITRARRRFELHASESVAGAAIARLSRRHSGLAERLGWPPAPGDGDGEPA